jgi:hypothetical protein
MAAPLPALTAKSDLIPAADVKEPLLSVAPVAMKQSTHSMKPEPEQVATPVLPVDVPQSPEPSGVAAIVAPSENHAEPITAIPEPMSESFDIPADTSFVPPVPIVEGDGFDDDEPEPGANQRKFCVTAEKAQKNNDGEAPSVQVKVCFQTCTRVFTYGFHR